MWFGGATVLYTWRSIDFDRVSRPPSSNMILLVDRLTITKYDVKLDRCMAALGTSRSVCPWCRNRIEATDKSITVGPPPHDASDTHRWTLHRQCALQWKSVGEKLFHLSKMGAHRTLIEYPKNHGTANLIDM